MATRKILDYENGEFVYDASKLPTPMHDDAYLGNQPLGIISIIGEHGSGKSFLQNVMLNYLQINENSFIDSEKIINTFALEDHNEAQTTGIDVFDKYILFDAKREGRQKHYVSIWDTEGSLDPHQDERKIPAILGMAAFCSSVVIYNIKSHFDSNNMRNMEKLLDDLRVRWKVSLDNMFQDLVIVIRDWDDDRYNFGFEGGEEYKKYQREKNREGKTAGFFRMIENVFRSVRVFLMPQPNYHVMKRALNKDRKMSDIEEPFKSSLLRFCQVVANEVLEPRTIEGQQTTIYNLHLYMSQYQQEFRNKEAQGLNTVIEETKANSFLQNSLEFYQSKCSSKFMQFFRTSEKRRKKHEENKCLALSTARKKLACFSNSSVMEALLGQLSDIIDEQFHETELDVTNSQRVAKKVLLSIGGVLIGSAAVALIVFVPASRPLLFAVCPKIVEFYLKQTEGSEHKFSQHGITARACLIPPT